MPMLFGADNLPDKNVHQHYERVSSLSSPGLEHSLIAQLLAECYCPDTFTEIIILAFLLNPPPIIENSLPGLVSS